MKNASAARLGETPNFTRAQLVELGSTQVKSGLRDVHCPIHTIWRSLDRGGGGEEKCSQKIGWSCAAHFPKPIPQL